MTNKRRQNLSLKYRPKRFQDLVGNDLVKEILANSIKKDKIRNAYAFFGGRGSGKTSSARIFAKALNCLNPINGEPCSECESCKLIDADKSVDVQEIDAASENSVQSIRELINSLHYMPTNSKRKVIILDEVHMLSNAAANTLLKTLEEPPNHVVFILCTTDPQKVLETIKSRTMIFNFQRLHSSDIQSRLRFICSQEGFQYEEQALKLIADSVNGGMRDAITMLDLASIQSETISLSVVKELVGFISTNDIIEFMINIEDPKVSLETLNRFLKKNQPFDIVNSLLSFFRDLFFIQNSVHVDSVTEDLIEAFKFLSSKFDAKKIASSLSVLTATLSNIKGNNLYDSSLYITDMYLNLYSVYKGEDRTMKTDVSLLNIFKGIQGNDIPVHELLSKFFNFKTLKGELVE